MKWAANLSLMYQEWSFADRPSAAAEDGFRHVECMFPYEVDAKRLTECAKVAEVEFVLINAPAGDWQGGDRGLACRPDRLDDFKRSIEAAVHYSQALGVKQIHVLAGTSSDTGQQAAWAHYLKSLDWLCTQTAELDLTWLIEPINTRDVPGYLLNTQAQAHNVVGNLGFKNLGVQMDLYHCQIVEGDVVSKLRQYIPSGRVKHLQIAGVPERNEPSRSELSLTRVVEELQSLGYRGAIGCEYRPQSGTRQGLEWLKQVGF